MLQKSLIIFLTHNFKNCFIQTLTNLDASIFESNYDCIVLYDNTNNTYLNDQKHINFQNIKIIPTHKPNLLYDHLNHAHDMYIDYLYQNIDILKTYEYIWIIENDVYYHTNIKDFIDLHSPYQNDLLCPEIGLRTKEWIWPKTLYGLSTIAHHIGITAPIFRMSSRVARTLVDGLINNHFGGFFESLLPNLCINFNYSMIQFLPETIGLCHTFKDKLINNIEKDIINKTDFSIENKLYHPIKL